MHRQDLAARADLIAWVDRWIAGAPPANVWIGATVVNQLEADRDIPRLLAVPARVRFLSIEPMLGPVDLTRIKLPLRGESFETANVLWRKDSLQRGAARASIDWVICGGESGPHARPLNSYWVRSLRDQCARAGVPFHWKQWGEWADASNPAFGRAPPREVRLMRTRDWTMVPEGAPEWQDENAEVETVVRVGTKAAGRLLDGIEHNGFPRLVDNVPPQGCQSAAPRLTPAHPPRA